MKNSAIVAVAGAILASFMWIMWPMATTVAMLRSQTDDVTRQADAAEKQLRTLPTLQTEVAAYRARIRDLAAASSYTSQRESADGRASDALMEATEVLETAYRVRITDTRLDPLPRPSLAPAAVPVNAPPTPPPMPNGVPTPTVQANVAASPAPTPVPGFYQAEDIQTDPVAQIMDVYAGSFTIDGNYRDLIGALQDLPRQGALVRIISGGVCRDDHYDGPVRSLSVAFRLYMLPGEFGT